jgi:hypothetical protein
MEPEPRIISLKIGMRERLLKTLTWKKAARQ